ncbi:MAG: hypothetical protein KH366_26285, partial [Clostridiaceae bacterium]|nr:hypothetical protein [Clostridiaceae bacterium]
FMLHHLSFLFLFINKQRGRWLLPLGHFELVYFRQFCCMAVLLLLILHVWHFFAFSASRSHWFYHSQRF